MTNRWCPCPSPWGSLDENFSLVPVEHHDQNDIRRWLQESEEGGSSTGQTWEMVYVGVVLVFMFAALLSDRIGADMVMLGALTACMAANIVTVAEGVSGFSNEGVLTVLVLFVVAAGLQLTGGLDWYMSKLLGRPISAAAAQLRLMIPIAFISAFLNNTPVVVVMIPIIQKWSKTINISSSQLLIPLSFASILGGTCTLIGTSTNLVVQGLLVARYPDDPSMQIGLFDLGEYGIPIALIGMSYILLISPYLLPGGKRGRENNTLPEDDGSILLGARLTKWSPAAGRSVKRSGLRDTGGIYLVSVYRAATGNVHRAVGQDFVLNIGDILYFTGMVEEFGQFCEDHGLEVVTNEDSVPDKLEAKEDDKFEEEAAEEEVEEKEKVVKFASTVQTPIDESIDNEGGMPLTIDTNLLSPRASITDKFQVINRMRDMIRGYDPSMPMEDELQTTTHRELELDGAAKCVVVVDTQDLQDLVVVGVNAHDRPGLLLDISRALHSQNLQLHHTEAAVILDRSLSIWRCEVIDMEADSEEIWSVLRTLLDKEAGVESVKRRGLPVIRAAVTRQSRLVGKYVSETKFRETYKAAIVGVQKYDKSKVDNLAQVLFAPGDILVLQADEGSPLLVAPPSDFYSKDGNKNKGFFKGLATKLSYSDLRGSYTGAGDEDSKSMFKALTKKLGTQNTRDSEADESIPSAELPETSGNSDSQDVELAADGSFFIPDGETDEGSHNVQMQKSLDEAEGHMTDNQENTDAWTDLQVFLTGKENKESSPERGNLSREYLAAMIVSPKSQHTNKTVAQAGLDKLTGLFLVQVERPIGDKAPKSANDSIRVSYVSTTPAKSPSVAGSIRGIGGSEVGSTQGSLAVLSIPVAPDDVLEEGDILWYAGPAEAISDLRKIPGLLSFEDEELKQIDEKLHDRRLVQAVVARKGPLVGKTAAEVGFRTRYGAAVIAVHRDGTRVQDHPGNIKLQAGDVLLLEAGPTFISRNTDNQQSFALISEVKDSKPPRLNKLIPAVVLVVAMLAVVTAGVASLLVCGLITSFIMGCTGIISQQEARDAVNWEVYVTIACAFGIGIALTNSGLANLIAEGLVMVGESLGIGYAGLYGAVYLGTFLISNVVTNNAAAALMFPIAMEAAEQTGADPLLMSYDLMLAASASFMSPFGYTTNLLIYGPGGYKVKDFLYFGTPMQLVLWILTTALLSTTSNTWYFSWIITFAIFAVVVLVLVFPSLIKDTLAKGKDAANNAVDHAHMS